MKEGLSAPEGFQARAANNARARSQRKGHPDFRRRLSDIEREQMKIHQDRYSASREVDRFLFLMLGLIATVTFVGLYITGNL